MLNFSKILCARTFADIATSFWINTYKTKIFKFFLASIEQLYTDIKYQHFTLQNVRYFVNNHPTFHILITHIPNIPTPKNPTFLGFHIPDIPYPQHPEHLTFWTSHSQATLRDEIEFPRFPLFFWRTNRVNQKWKQGSLMMDKLYSFSHSRTVPWQIFSPKDSSPNGQFPKRIFSRRAVAQMTSPRTDIFWRIFPRITYFISGIQRCLIWTNYYTTELSAPAIIAYDTTRRNDTFSIFVEELLAF